MRNLIVLFVLALSTSVSISYAQQACTEMGCTSGLTIDVPPEMPWPHGAYTFTFTLDGKAAVCRGSLPLKDCESQSITCDTPGIMIMESGCALPPEAQGFGMIALDTFPAEADVKIERDGRTVLEKRFTPAYRDVTPNGARCEPKCRQASVSLAGP